MIKKRQRISSLYHDMGETIEKLLEEGESTQTILKAATADIGVWMEKRDAETRLLAKKGELRLSWLADEINALLRDSEGEQYLDSERAVNVLIKAKKLIRGLRKEV